MARYNRKDPATALPLIEKDIEENEKAVNERFDGLLDFFYPVGTVYETADSNFNPNDVWGGTWTKIEGRVLVGLDADDADFDTVGETGGYKGAWNHTHVAEDNGEHTHRVKYDQDNSGTAGRQDLYGVSRSLLSDGGVEAAGVHTHTINSSGSTSYGASTADADKANMPPYEVVAIWKRTA